ncbi:MULTISPECIES: alpha/beta fold hydrolase [Pontibacillus]|uniref:Alpha/beta hydrolase n=1 Tax=Pontibacillus chungwhensis TaxID=265426 RepID=A0ABY8UTN8_9BACI|nr:MULTISPECIES: alpha/beta hydrolase [Pontibacillus]MCD5323302.1 alpha/beta hydrolase [Pontibacillus sp. HN14]WIF96683.1 alpha/beta hydrolase [Pontibacillus chungwhensis]
MKDKRVLVKTLSLVGLISIMLIIVALFFPTWTPKVKGDNSISTLEQVNLNGTGHEIMIRGQDRGHPVVIFVHGGPGSSELTYADAYQSGLEDQFTVVNYDQRGTGKSYHFLEDYSNLSSSVLVEDLLALTDYVSDRLEQEKVILVGHSYGTYIAMQAAAKEPEKFEAYVGIGQMSDVVKSEVESWNFAMKEAKAAGDQEVVEALQDVKMPVYSGETVTPRRSIMKYGGATRKIENPDKNLVGKMWSSEYNLMDVIRYLRGISISQEALLPEVFEHPLPSIVTNLDVPVYFIMGDYDYQTSSAAAKDYFDTIKAKEKGFVRFEESAHYPQIEEKETFEAWMEDTFAQ